MASIRQESKPFDTAILHQTVQDLHAQMRAAEFAAAGWLVIDNSHLTVDETVAQIQARIDRNWL